MERWHVCKISKVSADGQVEVSIKLGHWIQPGPENVRKVSVNAPETHDYTASHTIN